MEEKDRGRGTALRVENVGRPLKRPIHHRPIKK